MTCSSNTYILYADGTHRLQQHQHVFRWRDAQCWPDSTASRHYVQQHAGAYNLQEPYNNGNQYKQLRITLHGACVMSITDV